ncbi:MAG: o-succinylbenzoate synthase [Mangrovibacterium sp.]
MIKLSVRKTELRFKRPAGTSRGVLLSRPVWYLFLEEEGCTGLGECAPLPGLSRETPRQIEQCLEQIIADPRPFLDDRSLLLELPSLRFALETAQCDLLRGGRQLLFPSAFTRGEAGIPVNGLIWMGEENRQREQIRKKLNAGFSCIKLKIGSLDFERELKLLGMLREAYRQQGPPPAGSLTLRVDANGAFSPEETPKKLERLARFKLHSVEQPVPAGNPKALARICKESTVPVALDEELIGLNRREEKEKLLDTVRPHFLVLKPSLHGGFSGCDEWISLAAERSIGWWITSCLESNAGLNAIAQWTFTKQPRIHQGLGTGQLFINNLRSPLEMCGDQLRHNPRISWSRPK